MKYKKLRKTSSSSDSLSNEFGVLSLGFFYPYDCASIYKLYDSNYSLVPGARWLISRGNAPLKSSIKNII